MKEEAVLLAGETEPLRKYGILLNDAALRQEALKLGLVKTTKDALSPQNKTLAAQSLILKDLGPAQGDFARTSSSAANQQRILRAEEENLSAELGQTLLPAYQRAIGLLSKLTGAAHRHQTAAKALIVVTAGVAAAFVAAKAAYAIANSGLVRFIRSERVAAVATRVLAAAQASLDAALVANPIGLIIAAIIALGVALVIAYKKSATFRRIVNAAFDVVKGAAKSLAGDFSTLVGWLKQLVSWAAHAASKLDFLGDAAGKVGDIAGAIGGVFHAHGGLTAKGQSIILGERGPEAMTSPGGFVIPSGATAALAGGGPLIHVEKLIVRDRLDAELVAASLSRKLALR